MPALSTQEAEKGAPGQSEATSPSRMQMPTTGDRAAAAVLEKPAETARPKVNADPSPPGENAVRSPVPPLPASAQEVQSASDEARLKHAFEQFLKGREQASIGQRDREALFVEFK